MSAPLDGEPICQHSEIKRHVKTKRSRIPERVVCRASRTAQDHANRNNASMGIIFPLFSAHFPRPPMLLPVACLVVCFCIVAAQVVLYLPFLTPWRLSFRLAFICLLLCCVW
jgi:hypothetical protein